MAINSVKITDLNIADGIKDDDVFLISTPQSTSTLDTIPYTSKQLSFKRFFESLKLKIASWKANITELWSFTNGIKTNTVDEKDDKSVVNIGHIKNMMIGGNYPENMIMPSYVGMIIHSATLDTLDKVKNRYGENTNWIRYNEFFLRSCPNEKNIKQNNNNTDNGSDFITLTDKNIPKHCHKVPEHTHTITHDIHCSSTKYYDHLGTTTASGGNNKAYGVNEHKSTPSIRGSVTCISCKPFNTESYGDGEQFSIVPAFKYVYIWERIENDQDAK